jgi:hypothetical protein
VFAAAASEGIDIILTGVYNGTPDAVEGWRGMLEPIARGGGRLLYVQLTCDRDEIFRRLPIESRAAHGKLIDLTVLAARMEREDLFAVLPFQPSLTVDTTHQSPQSAALLIAEHFHLPQS